MWWFILCLAVGLSVAAALYLFRRKWIMPWWDVERLVRQIGRGERPRTFLLGGSRQAERVGIALEDIFIRQQELTRQLDQHAAGQKAIFAALHDPLLVIDGERRLVLFNRAAQELFSIDQSSLGGLLLDAVRDPIIDEAIGKGLHEATMFRREMFLGDRHWQATSMPLQDDAGVATGAVVLLHEITELKKIDQVRRDFVANVSHELRTPLSILRGYVETLLDSRNVPREELTRILRVMERHSNRLELLVEDLLTLAQLESGNSQLQLGTVDLASFFRETIRDWEKKLTSKQLNIVIDVPPDLPPIRADRARLQEAFYNLLDNAVKYSRERSEIRLSVRSRDGEIELNVSDEGIGIAEEDLPRIFERFYRGDKARSPDKIRGTGLGLAIVKHIAQLHGGRVEAESELGEGTTIRVILPG